jgi:hypothetical protein
VIHGIDRKRHIVTLDPHIVTLAIATLGAGWLMALAGLQKNALERRRRKRRCPACGRELRTDVCSCSS